ncbi:MAG: helix-turn-helix domain-containing protein, partial [Actinomycetota bacterium]|nr:helix-turn-helix domain-containing protein [Actinomycetota bacterium]
MAVKPRFTRIPKVCDLISAGVPTEAIPTYCALADFSNNKTGLCWPRMETLARRLSRSPRTIQRHLHLLKAKGLVEFVERKRDRCGRFGAYVYRLVHLAALTAAGGGRENKAERGGSQRRRRGSKKRLTTGHGGPAAPIKGQTRRQEEAPQPPKGDPKEGYWWLFGEEVPPGDEERARREAAGRREEAARR